MKIKRWRSVLRRTMDHTHEEYDKIEQKADAINEKANSRGLGANIEAVVGICHNCTHYKFAENELHQIVYSICDGFSYDYPIRIGKQKIKYCTQHSPNGQLDIDTMMRMAHLIDLDNLQTTRKQAGFTSEELKDHEKDKNR